MSPLKAAVVQVVATWVVAVIFKIVSHFLHTPVEELALIIACNALVLMLMHKSNDGRVGGGKGLIWEPTEQKPEQATREKERTCCIDGLELDFDLQVRRWQRTAACIDRMRKMGKLSGKVKEGIYQKGGTVG